MDELLKKWSELGTGWKLYVAGCVLICLSIWTNYGLADASTALGACCVIGAFVKAMKAGL